MGLRPPPPQKQLRGLEVGGAFHSHRVPPLSPSAASGSDIADPRIWENKVGRFHSASLRLLWGLGPQCHVGAQGRPRPS